MKYEDIRDKLKAGDVLLFSGRGFISWLIRLRTWSKISHNGMVYKIGQNVMVWESTRLTGKDGVQISLLSVRGKRYKGKISVRQLHTRRDNKFYTTFNEVRQEMKGKKYERNILELWGSVAFWKNKVNLTYIFCSELLGLMFKRWGLFKRNFPENELVPVDFTKKSKKVTGQFVTGTWLGPAIDLEF